jgi:hypothetical protein
VHDSDLLDRCLSLTSVLSGEERTQGERVIAICRALQDRERQGGRLVPAAEDLELKRELGRLVELLSRRSAKAIALGKLGRSALADLAGDVASARAIAIECEVQLAGMGL